MRPIITAMTAMRLDKLLSALGAASRSNCRDLIRAGRVKVNGAPAKKPADNVPPGAEVMLDGQALDIRLTRHVMLHKPAGVLTAREDARQQTVMDLLPPVYASLGCMPVGRLDKDTTGLLILTTDGELAHRLLAPQRHVDKVYEARVEGTLAEEDREAFAAGIAFKDFTALPAALDIIGPDLARVTVREGKYHQVKRMFAARGKPVTALRRLRFGPIRLDEALQPGQYRELTEEEAAALYAAAGMTYA